MSSKRYLVLGYSEKGMGRAVAHDLIRQRDTGFITLMDRDKSSLKLAKELEDSSSVECEYIVSDIDKMNLPELFKYFDVVVSALPTQCSPKLLRAVIEASSESRRVGFCELGGVVQITEECLSLDIPAKKAGVSAVLDGGLQPGLGMILGRILLNRYSHIKEIGIYVGGMPQKPKPPVFHQNMYAVAGHKHLCYDKVPILEGNNIVKREPRTQRERIHVPVLEKYNTKFNGWVEAFLTAGASIAPWTFKDNFGVKIYELTLRWDSGFANYVDSIPENEFEEIMTKFTCTPVDENNPDFVYLKVVGKTHEGKIKGYFELHDEYDVSTSLNAMQRTTGFTEALLARWIARGKISPGVNTPEFSIQPRDFNEFLTDMGNHLNIKEY